MKRFVHTSNDRMIKLEDLVFVDCIRDIFPTEITQNTKFDNEGNVLPYYGFDLKYKDGTTVTPMYYDIEEAYQDRKSIYNELNKE